MNAQIEEIRKLMLEHQQNTEFQTIFDHIDDQLREIEQGLWVEFKPHDAMTMRQAQWHLHDGNGNEMAGFCTTLPGGAPVLEIWQGVNKGSYHVSLEDIQQVANRLLVHIALDNDTPMGAEHDTDFMCEECEKLIDESEWEMFGGKCEECSIQ